MTNLTGESENELLRLAFDRWFKLDFDGFRVTSDARVLAYWELDEALSLSDLVGGTPFDPRRVRTASTSFQF